MDRSLYEDVLSRVRSSVGREVFERRVAPPRWLLDVVDANLPLEAKKAAAMARAIGGSLRFVDEYLERYRRGGLVLERYPSIEEELLHVGVACGRGVYEFRWELWRVARELFTVIERCRIKAQYPYIGTSYVLCDPHAVEVLLALGAGEILRLEGRVGLQKVRDSNNVRRYLLTAALTRVASRSIPEIPQQIWTTWMSALLNGTIFPAISPHTDFSITLYPGRHFPRYHSIGAPSAH